ncbi:MAG TPA: N-acetylmuramoyl-L-alanine amidase [Deltaproteobacteria bacterium]|nr:N-acetylmuramoyl-L-alanine amidase [Deltaproteobacteria bacterium]
MIRKIKKLIMIVAPLALVFFICHVSSLEAADKKYTLVIDAAHGGSDKGVKITEKISEKDITLELALAIKEELSKESNIKTVLTRDDDSDLSKESRKKIANEVKADFVLIIHINSGFGRNASGFELYYPGFGEDLKNSDQRKIRSLNESVKMSHLIQRNLDAIFPRKGRGLREAELPMFDGLHTPALVVEIGFGSNRADRRKLLSSKSQAEIAQALSKSIITYFR